MPEVANLNCDDHRLALGRLDEARRAYAEALAVIEGVAAGLADEALRRTFLDSPHVRAVRAQAA